MDPVVARKNWRTSEPLHAFVYFAPEASVAYETVGLDGMAGYFASRSAPMGAVSAATVRATFFNFHPALVAEAMAGVWERTTPAEVVEARLGAVDAVLRSELAGVLGSDELARAAELLRVASDACDTAGRPLAAGQQSLERPDDPHLALWHDLTVVREFRGDGHVSALVAGGLGPLEALVLHAASGEVPAEVLRRTRRWSDDEWRAGVETLRARGLVDGDGGLTDEGRRCRDGVETTTDRLALAPWEALGEPRSDELRRLVRPWSKALVAAGRLG